MSVVKTEAWVAIVEDSLDVAMAVGSVVYVVLINDTDFALSTQSMAAIGGTAGTVRFLLRRILRRVVQLRLSEDK